MSSLSQGGTGTGTDSTPLFRLTKRQRLEGPVCWMDCESIETVVSGSRVLRTPAASQLTQDLFMDRFQKEIAKPFRFSLSSQIQLLDRRELGVEEGEDTEDTVQAAKERRQQIRARLRIGINACTRALEAACYEGERAPSLLVLTTSSSNTTTSSDPSISAHLPALAQRAQVPLLLLPSTTAATELGTILGIPRVTALAFVPQNRHGMSSSALSADQNERLHAAVDSFVEFARGKVVTPSSSSQPMALAASAFSTNW